MKNRDRIGFNFLWVLGLAGLLTALSSLQGQAGVETQISATVTCFLGGCLQEGWQIIDHRRGQVSEVRCLGRSCEEDGWFHQVVGGRADHFTQCLGRGCFLDGWQIFDFAANQLQGEAHCRVPVEEGEAECLRAGWDVYNQVGQISHRVTCVGGDCRERGWDVQVVGYGFQSVRCQSGGCFEKGWTLRP